MSDNKTIVEMQIIFNIATMREKISGVKMNFDNIKNYDVYTMNYNELYDLCAANDIGMVLVNSNEAKRDADDSFEKMQEKAKKEGYKMHYVVDEKHQLADAFGATTTPHIFLFNRDAKLAYRGLIDDNGKEKEAVTQPYLKNAIKAMAANEKIDPEVTKSMGCSIKRVL